MSIETSASWIKDIALLILGGAITKGWDWWSSRGSRREAEEKNKSLYLQLDVFLNQIEELPGSEHFAAFHKSFESLKFDVAAAKSGTFKDAPHKILEMLQKVEGLIGRIHTTCSLWATLARQGTIITNAKIPDEIKKEAHALRKEISIQISE